MYNIELMKKDLQEKLSDYRYNHSLRVADISKELAKIYNIDEEEAYTAGLLHDIAKEFSPKDNQKIIEEEKLEKEISNIDNKRLIHGIIGAYYVKNKYNVNNDIINAIMYHTTGRINMSNLEKIVFIADKIDPQKKYPGIKEERKLAYKNLDKAVILCLENNIKKLQSENKQISGNIKEVISSLKK